MTSTQSALVGNGRLLVSLDASSGLLGASWPHVDSFNQVTELRMIVVSTGGSNADSQEFTTDRIVTTTFPGHVLVDEVLHDEDVWVRRVIGGKGVVIGVAPQLDGRVTDQTIYYDESADALLAYHRVHWMAIAGPIGSTTSFECGVGPLETDEAALLRHDFTGGRIASRTVHGLLKLSTNEAELPVFIVFAATREGALASLQSARGRQMEPTDAREHRAVTTGEALRAQSRNVIRLLSNRDTGGVIAGPPLQVDIPSEPGYAAVWARDAAWVMFGSLAVDDFDRVKSFLEFAFTVQSPEGLWLHRHHTDYSVGSSWGMHQLDETGIIVHLLFCYIDKSQDEAFGRAQWDGVRRAGEFLNRSIDASGLSLPTVDLWEERESRSVYTVASFIGGLRSAAAIAELTGEQDLALSWLATAETLSEKALYTFWSEDEGRFLKAIESRAALQLEDESRTDLPSGLQVVDTAGPTPLPAYPNWTTGSTTPVDLSYDISVLGLCVPFNVLAPDDPRIVSTVERLRSRLWVDGVGGFGRYEGDTYGGGNPWPVATLWVACYEASRGNLAGAEELIEWVTAHVGPNHMIAEQVHRKTGAPVAALPMAWSHGMVLLAHAACQGSFAWRPKRSIRGSADLA